jgi:hypothetical protein
MARNVPLGIVGIILLSGSLLFLWFVILSGVTTHTPLDKIYFLRADTSGITGARPITQWTYFFFCGPGNRDCGPPRPAPAFGKAWDGHAANVPGALIGSHGGNTTSFHYYYTWRFGWVFFLLTLFFSTLAWFASFLACCGRLGAAIASFIALIALGFMTLGTSLMTYVIRSHILFPRSFFAHNITVPSLYRLEIGSMTPGVVQTLAPTPSASSGLPGPACSSQAYSSASVSGTRRRATVAAAGAASAASAAAAPTTAVESRTTTLRGAASDLPAVVPLPPPHLLLPKKKQRW